MTKLFGDVGTKMMLVEPDYWPPNDRQELAAAEDSEGSRLQVEVTPDGAFDVRLTFQSRDQPLRFLSQPVKFKRRPGFSLFVRWDVRGTSEKMDVLINSGIRLRDGEETGYVRVLDGLSPRPESQISYEQPDAKSACSDQVKERSYKTYDSGERSRRRAATTDEELEKLEETAQDLKELTAEDADLNNSCGVMASYLRGLVNEQGDALLLRVASENDLPLPVYQRPDIEWPQFMRVTGTFINKTMHPTIEKQQGPQQLCDLQWALRQKVIFRPGDDSYRVTQIEFLREVANTTGPAHFSSTRSVDVEALDRFEQFGSSTLENYVAGVASTVARLINNFVVPRARDST